MAETGTWGGGIGDHRVFEVKIAWIQAGQQCSTSYHIRDVGVATLSPEDVATEAAELANSSAFRSILRNQDQIVSVDATNLVTKDGHTVALTNVVGLADVNPLASFSACAVGLVSGKRVRYGNGRMFWPVRGTIFTDGDRLVGAGITAFDNLRAEFTTRYMDDGVTATQRLVHLHEAKPERPRKAGPPNLPAVPASWYDVTAIKINRALTPLRSRKVGVGS